MSKIQWCKNIFKKFDYFGVNFNFYYQDKKKYHSATGGIIFILFLLITVTYVSINVPIFLNHKNMSIIFYSSQLSKTDSISLSNHSSMIAIGLTCDTIRDNLNINDMLSIQINYVNFTKKGGILEKNKIPIEYSPCTHSSFYNNFNETFDQLRLDNFFCPLIIQYPITGTYSDSIFTYYEFIVKEKNETNKGRDILIETLTTGECQLGFHFLDSGVDIQNYSSPKQNFINSKFLVLKPEEITKMNLFLKLEEFNSDQNILFEKYKTEYFLSFGNSQEYSVYKGLDRFEKFPRDFEIFAKIYIRADIERTLIQRKYMKCTEFIANMSSMFSQIFFFLYVIVGFINTFYSNQSLMKKIFQFKEGGKKSKDGLKQKLKTIKFKTTCEPQIIINQEGDNRYNANVKRYLTNYRRIDDSNTLDTSKKTMIVKMKSKKEKAFYIKQNEKKKEKAIKLGTTKIYKNKTIKFNYSLIELVTNIFFPCFSWRNLKRKNILLDKAKKKLFFQLDVLSYLKKMQLLDLLNYVILEKHENVILHFLSKPSISFANKIDIYDKIQSATNTGINSNEINEFFSSVQYLFNKISKTSAEERLCNITSAELNELLQENTCSYNTIFTTCST